MYIMASLAREVSYGDTMEYMDEYDNSEIGFYDWLDQHYPNRTINPEIIPMEEVVSSEPVRDTSELERMLLESYSASGRGIPISVPRENNAEVPF